MAAERWLVRGVLIIDDDADSRPHARELLDPHGDAVLSTRYTDEATHLLPLLEVRGGQEEPA